MNPINAKHKALRRKKFADGTRRNSSTHQKREVFKDYKVGDAVMSYYSEDCSYAGWNVFFVSEGFGTGSPNAVRSGSWLPP